MRARCDGAVRLLRDAAVGADLDRARVALLSGTRGRRGIRRPPAGGGQRKLARVFADATIDDKFSDVDWRWDDELPELSNDVCVAYLRCRRAARFDLYDHTILIGDVVAGRHFGGDPLLYLERQMGWRLSAG